MQQQKPPRLSLVNTASNGSAFHVNAGNSAVSQYMDGRGFPIHISVQICTHPDRSKTVRRNPERLRKSSTAVIPYYVHIYSQERGVVQCYMFATCLLGIPCVNHLLRRKNCTRRPIRSFIHMMMTCSLGATLFPPGPAP